jgi:5-oxopent-3-ene-1,2,5-tricarboxylate decarboxylase / 2-hydroxyhepta-2,4-diene-1,7-dioate isomerase
VVSLPETIETWIDGQHAHSWHLDRLVRGPAQLISDLAEFMTLRAGDVLLIGLPDDGPLVHAGQSLRVSADGLPVLVARLVENAA